MRLDERRAGAQWSIRDSEGRSTPRHLDRLLREDEVAALQ
jgi:hypothetical protein